MTEAAKIHVGLDCNSYDIHIGAGLLAHAGEKLKEILSGKKICVVTDDNIAKIYLMPLMKTLEAAGFICYPPIILPAGEETKSFKYLQSVVDKSLSYKLDRFSTLVALGGGVVGDITGFAASVIMRGINFVQIPTTLLAQVDSSVGGKTGINTQEGKNLVGSFYQPKAVLIDTDTLKTLPEREKKAGYAEILKYALVNDANFFDWLEENGKSVLSGDAQAQQKAIETSCKAKAAIVAADETERKDIRALLNLGHSFGHALEALGSYDGRLLHGEAVAIGMRLAFEFSENTGVCPAADVLRVKSHLGKMGLPLTPPFKVTAAAVLDKMRGDKKNRDGGITLVLARGIGKAFVDRRVDGEALKEFLERSL